MLPRFFAPLLEPAAGQVTLPPDEAAHLRRVLRLAVGDTVAVFDGRGTEYRARVASASHGTVTLALLERIAPTAEPGVRLALAQAVLKTAAMDDVVRDATMMGITRIDPIVSSHVAVKESVISSGRALERWRRVAVASAKQCRRATVPSIERPVPFAEWLRASNDEWRLMLVEPSAAFEDEQSMRSLGGRARPTSAALVVGPEGGWTEAERREARNAGCFLVTVGALTLRADAVPVAAIALLRFVLEDL